MSLIDTHCHIHDTSFSDKFAMSAEQLYDQSLASNIIHLICVGTDLQSSIEAVEFASGHPQSSASVALHPHESVHGIKILAEQMTALDKLIHGASGEVVAVGECGLDYYYHTASKVKKDQIWLLKQHLSMGLKYEIPFIFHVREAFDDFFATIDDYNGVSGVIHSFSAGMTELEGILSKGLYVGLNGIMTFTKDAKQLEAAKAVPIERLVLETDAPFLTPKPFRGTICKPKHVLQTAEFLSDLRGESLEVITTKTTENAKRLFGSRLKAEYVA